MFNNGLGFGNSISVSSVFKISSGLFLFVSILQGTLSEQNGNETYYYPDNSHVKINAVDPLLFFYIMHPIEEYREFADAYVILEI
ncbi:hypothetical protein ABER02_22525 [Rossellomorea marisflavi]|uniref:hypothetical protein n=1 Tax=Rossellomorea marisflavi TaxID=189381 RepID=UPI003D2D16F0